MPYDKYEEPDSSFLKLTTMEDEEEMRLKLVSHEKTTEGKYASPENPRWKWVVQTEDNEEKTIEADAPGEKNNGKGSQFFRSMAMNEIEPGDVFIITCKKDAMRTQYGRQNIYEVAKEHASDKPAPGKDVNENLAEDVEEVFGKDGIKEDASNGNDPVEL